MPRSAFGDRHELGQNFLHHRPAVTRMTELVAEHPGSILGLGAGDGALTRPLASLQRPMTAVELDEHRVRRLQSALPHVQVMHGDALRVPLDTAVVVGNIPYHVTTPMLRRMLGTGRWQRAVLLTQWEVARKRAGVGGGTLLTAQSAPWFTFTLHGRVPSWAFSPRPSVDGGLLVIDRRSEPLVPYQERGAYASFVRRVFSARGRGFAHLVSNSTQHEVRAATRLLRELTWSASSLPRDLQPEHRASLWGAVQR